MTTFFSGMADETDLCFTGSHPLEDVLGVVQEEIDAPSEEFENRFLYSENAYPAVRMCEIVHAKEGTEVLSVYERDFYAGFPAVTRRSYGEGQAYYLAAESDLSFLRRFYEDVFDSCGMKNALGAKLPYGVTAAVRTSCRQKPADAGLADSGEAVFVMNFRNEPVSVECRGDWRDAETGETYSGKIPMEAFGCKVLSRTK